MVNMLFPVIIGEVAIAVLLAGILIVIGQQTDKIIELLTKKNGPQS